MTVRDATPDDAAACAAIYAPYVEDSPTSFETVAPTEDEVRARIEAALATHAWVVLEEDGHVVGYAYAGPWRGRAAYQWNAEVSVYLARGRGGRGDGTALYTALLERLVARGYHVALAGMVVPNPASERLHASLGFETVGTFRGVGWKQDAWQDVQWAQKSLVDDPGGPPGVTPPGRP
jgi:L-amino acid N-acyltransferase YncA